nr:MAG TPA: hypothetical protein [Bacteriophage sp.]
MCKLVTKLTVTCLNSINYLLSTHSYLITYILNL